MKINSPDGLISWLVVLACFFFHFICFGFNRLTGLIFIEIKKLYSVSRNNVAYAFTTRSVMAALAGPLAGYVAHKCSLRTPIFLGTCVASLGCCLSFWAPNLVWFTVFQGIIYGLGRGMSFPLLPKLIKHHFKKHTAKALGLYTVSGAVSTFLAPFYEYLIKNYGILGTLLIHSCLIMQGIPIALLLKTHNVRNSKKKPNQSLTSKKLQPVVALTQVEKLQGTNDLKLNDDRVLRNKQKVCKPLKEASDLTVEFVKVINTKSLQTDIINQTDKNHAYSFIVDLQSKANPTDFEKLEVTEHVNENEIVHHHNEGIKHNTRDNQLILYETDKLKHGDEQSFKFKDSNVASNNERKTKLNSQKIINMSKYQTKPEDNKINENKRPEQKQSMNESIIIQMFKLWRDPIFLMLCIMRCINNLYFSLVHVIFIDIFLDKGINVTESVKLLTIYGAADLIGRLSFGWVIDRGWMKWNTYSAFWLFLRSMCFVNMAFCEGFTMSAIAVAALGLTIGANSMSNSGLIFQFVPEEKQILVLTNRSLITLPVVFGVPSLIGYFRNSLGSYFGLFFLLAGLFIVGCILQLLLPIVEKRSLRKQTMKKDKTEK